jgi:hypothetical protein
MSSSFFNRHVHIFFNEDGTVDLEGCWTWSDLTSILHKLNLY